MRPRSKLLSKEGLLLPTISEGTEETLKDLNEANTQHVADHVSSDDYLLSICHLAHPTFPTDDVSPSTHQLDGVHQRMRASHLTHRPKKHERGVQQVERIDVLGCSDPLEYLYGHRDNRSTSQSRSGAHPQGVQHESEWKTPAHSRAHSTPHAAGAGLPQRRKSSGPDLHTDVPSVSAKHCRPTLVGELGSVADSKAHEEVGNPNKKQSMVSQWISDCRSAWREGRMRACMLPAITEI
ncbi:uncharacterized protein si:dkeyp-72g9.4 [Phyllopteryx taeniolatus]|uniref:uncharacterized protein si:dkeyp-72g9.4 n=1 Tax=Phyllopteryx taeniolatus TaxID=161469 RepID=UPI002AD3C19A|nr:uncharacterized protein si:dkeyp-72g9.4 [Phyllopteryx taeniolatus]